MNDPKQEQPPNGQNRGSNKASSFVERLILLLTGTASFFYFSVSFFKMASPLGCALFISTALIAAIAVGNKYW